jgi:predicted porin
MKKISLVLGLLAAGITSAYAQSSVTIGGIVDAAFQHKTNAGATAATKGDSLNSVIPGGMSQSRLNFNVVEDMGGGLKAMASLEHRLLVDAGTAGSSNFWQQSWVGLESKEFGRITLGRQFNVLFDAMTSTYASYKYSPYVEPFKPEIGMTLGARNDNMVKYLIAANGFVAEVQYSLSENNALAAGASGQSTGGFLKYAQGPFAVVGAYMALKDACPGSATCTNKQAKQTNFGGSYTSGPLYLSAGWGKTQFELGFPAALNAAIASGVGLPMNANLATTALTDNRTMVQAGGTYQLTSALNLGANYWSIKQTGVVPAFGDGTIKMMNVVADYAFSKRTEAYVHYDHSVLGGNLMLNNTATKRDNFTVGMRHRF